MGPVSNGVEVQRNTDGDTPSILSEAVLSMYEGVNGVPLKSVISKI